MGAVVGSRYAAHRLNMSGLSGVRIVAQRVSAMSKTQGGLRCASASNQAGYVAAVPFRMSLAPMHYVRTTGCTS